jgi:hypothetical protein
VSVQSILGSSGVPATQNEAPPDNTGAAGIFQRLLTPQGGAIDRPKPEPKIKDARIYVIDGFSMPYIGPRGGPPVVPHGEFVDAIIRTKTGLPTIRINWEENGRSETNFLPTIKNAIDQIASENRGRESKVFINMSFAVRAGVAEKYPKEYAALMNSIGDLIKKGAHIFTGAGNEELNLMVNIPGIITVGANDEEWVKSSEIDDRQQSRYIFKVGDFGLDFNGDSWPDILVPSILPNGTEVLANGVSMASPTSLSEAVLTGIIPVDRN